MFGAEQGMDWRLLTEEEGSIGPRGPWNIHANDPVDLEAFQRLNTLDSATGQLRPGEAGVAAELENYTGSTMQRAGAASGPDFEFTSGPYNGQTVDMMYTPSTVEQANNLNQYFNQNLPALEENLTSHASKADLVAIDMRVLSSQNQASMMNAINSLPSALQSKFILLW
jgi:filamentous hemagglutinin